MSQIERNETDYKRYKDIKAEFDIHHNGYNLQSLIAHDIARFAFLKKLPKIKSVFRWFVIPSHNYFATFFKHKYLTSNVYPQRKDYCSLFGLIRKELGISNKTIDYIYGKQIRFVLSFKNIFKSIKEAYNAKEYLNFIEILFFAACLTYYKNILDSFEKRLVSVTKTEYFFASNSSSTPDSILCLYFNKLGVKTYSFQHGAYSSFQSFVPMDIINIENMTSEKMLCWGQSTVDLMVDLGYDLNSLEITGNPRYKNIKLHSVKQSFKTGIVFLGRFIYDEENVKLLELLSDLQSKIEGLKISVKPHPTLNEDKYKKLLIALNLELIDKDKLLTELINSGKYDFAVSYNSTAYYEPLTRGIPCFRFSLNENENIFGMDDKFISASELEQQISQFKKMKSEDLLNKMKSVLQYVFNIDNVDYIKLID